MILLDGSSHSTLKVKLAASNARMAAASLPHIPIPQPLPRASVASAFQSLIAPSFQPSTSLSTPSARGPRSPAPSPASQPVTASLTANRPSVSASKETLSLDDTPAVRKEKAKIDKQEKQKQKQEKKAEQKVAKEERRQSKKVEKESSKREQEQLEAEVKSTEEEERKSKEALQTVSSRAASSAVQVHSPPPSTGSSIVDELTDYLAASSLSGITRQLDQQFEQILDSKRTKPATTQSATYGEDDQQHGPPPPGFAALSTSASPLSSQLLTSQDTERAARIDFAKLDRAMPTTPQQPPSSSSNKQQQQQQQRREGDKAQRASESGEQKQKQQHDVEEDEDFQRYQQQQAAHLVPDDGEYEQIAESADHEATEETGVADVQESGGNWDDDEPKDASDSKRDVNDVDIGALNLQDMTEDEIVLAMVREFEAKQAADHGLTHDISTADMTDKLRTYLLDQEEEGPTRFDQQSAREKRRQTRENETEEERRKRKDAKYKQRAQDAAEGILDWEWSSDSSTSGSEEGSGEDEDDEDEDDEDVDDNEDELDDEEVDVSDEEDEEDEEVKSDDEEVESTAASDKGARAAVCTCFKPLSAHDPAIIAAQLASFISSDVNSQYTHASHILHTQCFACSHCFAFLLCCVSQGTKLNFPPFGVPLHRSNVHRLGQLFGVATESEGEGTARFTRCVKTDATEAADSDELQRAVKDCTRQMQQLADKCPVHVLPLLEAATRDEEEMGRWTAAALEKKARKQQREEKLMAKRTAKEDKARQKLQKRMDKMKGRLKVKAKKGKHAWQNGATEEDKRAKREEKTAKRMVGMVTSSAIPIPVSNTGHQMLLALGWKGGGLGKKNDGRDQPVAAVVKLNSKGLGFVR